jgi:hypothetical protein
MDLIRKERNELLQEETNDELTLQNLKNTLQTQTVKNSNKYSIHSMTSMSNNSNSNSKKSIYKTNESEYLQIQFDFFNKFIDWIQTESKTLLTSSGNFLQSSSLTDANSFNESNELIDETSTTISKNTVSNSTSTSTTKVKDYIHFGTSRRSIGFETLSTPTKNLILALGDVQLQKSLKEEHYLNEFLKFICYHSLQAYTVFNACKTSILDMNKSSQNRKNDVESKICCELFSTNEYISVLSKINTIDSILNDVFDNTKDSKLLLSHSNSNYNEEEINIHNIKDIQKVDTLLTNHSTYCEKLRHCTKKLETIVQVQSLNPNNTKSKYSKNFNNSLNSFKEIDERLKLRLKKNEISKQKLVELSKSSTSAYNLSKVLETLRLAETEIDDQIEKLSFIIQESSQSQCFQLQKQDGKQNDQLSDTFIKIQIKENDLLHLKTMIDESSIMLSSVSVKISLLKNIVNMEIEEEIKKYQIELNESILKKCLQIKEQVYENFQLQKKMYFEDLLLLNRSETTLKTELQNLLKIIRNDSRGVDQCLRSMTNMSKIRSEKINFECLDHYKTFLESLNTNT